MLGKIFFHPSIFPVLFLAFFLFNAAVLQSASLGLVLLVVYLGIYGWDIGTVVAGQEKGPARWWIGCIVLLCGILLLLTTAYYLFSVPKELVVLIILLTPPLVGILVKRASGSSLLERFHAGWLDKKHRVPRGVLISSSLILLFGAHIIQTLVKNGITDAVRSPWERLDTGVILLMGIMLILLFGLLARGRERALTLVLTGFVLFVFISLVLFVFPLGYGFDSFIHRATEEHLAVFATIEPKPFYYIGQYVLVLFLKQGFFIPIDIADAYLVPLLTALLLPLAWYNAARHIVKNKRAAMVTLTGIFFIPLASFIVTTPQALANLFTLLLVLASVPYLFESERPRLWLCGVLAFSTLAIHPIAGLPAMLYFALLSADPSRAPRTIARLASFISGVLIVLASVILPASFLLNAMLSGQQLSVRWSELNPMSLIANLNLRVFFENKFNPALDFAYLYGRNAVLILTVTALLAWWAYKKELPKRTRVVLWMAFALGVNYLIMKSMIDFTFLINYERLNYAERLIPLVAFFLVPFFILGIGHMFVNLINRPIALKAGVLLLMCGLALSGYYMTYPRHDAYETSRAFNTSVADFATVRLTEEWANGEPYLVLANQSVSAAAISEIGFRYYGSLFFYPIPTGDALYEQFLAMNETPTREIARTALNLVPMHGDVSSLFYAVNDYWWDAPRIIETAKTTANDWRATGGVHIFRYDF